MSMHFKQGEVFLQHQKYGEKWKRNWMVLHPSSRNGVARLELTEECSERSAVVRRQPERRVIRLADCVSAVRLPPHAEACPRDNMAAFCVETETKRLVLAAERESCEDWVEKICEMAFQGRARSGHQQVPQMEKNQIYESRDDLCMFQVCVQPSEAAARSGLQGLYWLRADREALVLKDLETKKMVLEWPYKLLRRYGRDTLVFSIEAGRRCDSGPGTFHFETRQGDEILHLIESAIQEQKSLAVGGVKRKPRSPLPRRPDSVLQVDSLTNMSSDSGGSSECLYSDPADATGSTKHPSHDSHEPIYSTPADAIGSSEPIHPNPPKVVESPVYAHPADVIFSHTKRMPDKDWPTANSVEGVRVEPVYSCPIDLICQTPNADECIYADPADTVPHSVSLALTQPGHGPESMFSKVHNVVTQTPEKSPVRTTQMEEEPIYSEPVLAPKPRPEDIEMPSDKRDETPPIYSQVIKLEKSQPQNKTSSSNRISTGIVIEDLGQI